MAESRRDFLKFTASAIVLAATPATVQRSIAAVQKQQFARYVLKFFQWEEMLLASVPLEINYGRDSVRLTGSGDIDATGTVRSWRLYHHDDWIVQGTADELQWSDDALVMGGTIKLDIVITCPGERLEFAGSANMLLEFAGSADMLQESIGGKILNAMFPA